MKSISIPFRFEKSTGVPATKDSPGSVAYTTDNDTIARQRIVDVLATRNFERVNRPTYGAGISDLLFEPIDNLSFADYKIDALQEINDNVSNARIRDILIKDHVPGQYDDMEDSTLQIRVVYDTSGNSISSFTAVVNSHTIITEESPI